MDVLITVAVVVVLLLAALFCLLLGAGMMHSGAGRLFAFYRP